MVSMSEIIKVGSVEGRIKATVMLEFLPIKYPDNNQERINLDSFDLRLQAVADIIAISLEKQSIEELEARQS